MVALPPASASLNHLLLGAAWPMPAAILMLIVALFRNKWLASRDSPDVWCQLGKVKLLLSGLKLHLNFG